MQAAAGTQTMMCITGNVLVLFTVCDLINFRQANTSYEKLSLIFESALYE